MLVGSFCEQPPLELILSLEKSGCDVVDDAAVERLVRELVERHRRPCVVIALDGGSGRGSGGTSWRAVAPGAGGHDVARVRHGARSYERSTAGTTQPRCWSNQPAT